MVNEDAVTLQEKEATRRKPLVGEIGSIGRSHSALFAALGDDEYLSELTWPQNLTVYEKMRRSDSQIQALLLVLELPIRSTKWFIEPASRSAEDKKIAEFIETNLFSGPPVGMTQHWDDFLRLALMMLPFGYSIFEKVFEVRDDNMTHWRKFAHRPAKTIYDFRYDENGGPLKIEHLKVTNTSYETVFIDIEKLLIFSHRMEGGDLRGNSVLRSPYKHWKIKDFLYKLANVGFERNYIGTPVGKLPPGYGTEDIKLLKEVVENLRSSDKGGATLPPEFVVELLEGKRNLLEIMPYIEHQDLMIVRSALAHFMQLGTGNVGSWALSEDQSDLFLMTLNSVANYIANTINSHAIPQLVGYNWRTKNYPTLKFKPLGGFEKLVKLVKELSDGRLIAPDEGIEDWVRDLLDLPERSKPRTPPAPMPLPLPPEPEEDPPNPEEGRNTRDPRKTTEKPRRTIRLDEAGNRVWYRDLTTYEKVVNLEEIERRFDAEEERFVRSGFDIVRIQVEDLAAKVQKALDTEDYDALAKAPMRYMGKLTEFLANNHKELTEFGIEQAANELQVDRPSIPTSQKKITSARAGVVASQLAQRVKTRFVLQVLNGIESGQTVKASLFAASQDALSLAKRELVATASIQVGQAINSGRSLVANRNGVRLAQYSAILDQHTCPLCRQMDGRIIELTNPDFERFTAPIHNRCRCLWVFIRPEETPQPTPDWESPSGDLISEHGNLVLKESGMAFSGSWATQPRDYRGRFAGTGSVSLMGGGAYEAEEKIALVADVVIDEYQVCEVGRVQECDTANSMVAVIADRAGYQAEVVTGEFNGEGHTWARVGGVNIDLAAEQFGAERVRVFDKDSRYVEFGVMDIQWAEDILSGSPKAEDAIKDALSKL